MTAAPGADRGELATKAPSSIPPSLEGKGAVEVVSTTDRYGNPLRTVLCTETGLVRNDPVPGDEELAKFYSEEYRLAYKGAWRPRRRRVLRQFRWMVDHVRRFHDVFEPAERVLDIGAGSGEFVFLMRAWGKDAVGIEPDRAYSAWCREELGLDVRTARLGPGLFEAGSFDLIRLNHVLEHLNDPVQSLALVRGWLAPGGVVYVEVPNIEEYCRAKSRGNMFHYGHIWNFNPWTLRAVAGLAGFEELDATRERSAGTTGAVFRAGPVRAAADFVNPENAARVRGLIARHYAGGFLRGEKAVKPLVKLAGRIEEALSGALAGTPRDIGEKAARSLWSELQSARLEGRVSGPARDRPH